ncbi:sensor histidine kinase [Riemerella columbipharyngis]|uniref:histidine kinase n=1 Tax=Riemerella columbipharyngis TaxID=1071918 RepID=A0A1G7ENH9_9FLAO|nr:HAMP domain-containing sensor histidine kinase [Riemerella columbipharyngis]SDE64996.1 HAMP domain-containing protein [Riemerella columbipharyngis]
MNIRDKLFFCIFSVSIVCIVASMAISYVVFTRSNGIENQQKIRNKTKAITTALNYAVSKENLTQDNIKAKLENKIKEIADINNQNIEVYSLQGQYLFSNQEKKGNEKKRIPPYNLKNLEKTDINIKSTDPVSKRKYICSFILLRNNVFEPIAIVHYDSSIGKNIYWETFYQYEREILVGILCIIIICFISSRIIANGLTRRLNDIAKTIKETDITNKDFKHIKYYKDNELGTLINAYNSMITQIEDQKEQISYREKNEAWKEMAKQVAHEVKNPLTPMRLLVQNFERKFDVKDPNIETKVKQLTTSLVDQIDAISSVATAFSEYTKLPEKKDQKLNIHQETKDIIRLWNDQKEISLHSNKGNIIINMDKSYFTRIMNNLLKNAIQAKDDNRKLSIKVSLEQIHHKVNIRVEDNGIGIPENRINRIFEPNFTSKNSGMGLGLTMVKKLIEEYKGEISVTSEEGIGTTFLIQLPMGNIS